MVIIDEACFVAHVRAVDGEGGVAVQEREVVVAFCACGLGTGVEEAGVVEDIRAWSEGPGCEEAGLPVGGM